MSGRVVILSRLHTVEIDDPCSAERGAYWLGMLGFALAAPAATERAARVIYEPRSPGFWDLATAIRGHRRKR